MLFCGLRTADRAQQKYGYADQITHRASYDLLIDEVWTGSNRHKRRWTVQDAEQAVKETIDAARFMAHHKDRPAVLSVQGVNAAQYLGCPQVVPLLDTGDVLGFGGWCITGKMPSVMMPVFRETIPSCRALARPVLASSASTFGAYFMRLLWANCCGYVTSKISRSARIAQVRSGNRRLASGVLRYRLTRHTPGCRSKHAD